MCISIWLLKALGENQFPQSGQGLMMDVLNSGVQAQLSLRAIFNLTLTQEGGITMSTGTVEMHFSFSLSQVLSFHFNRVFFALHICSGPCSWTHVSGACDFWTCSWSGCGCWLCSWLPYDVPNVTRYYRGEPAVSTYPDLMEFRIFGFQTHESPSSLSQTHRRQLELSSSCIWTVFWGLPVTGKSDFWILAKTGVMFLCF